MNGIPTGSAMPPMELSWGEFEQDGDEITLRDIVHGNTLPANRVDIIQGFVGGSWDGLEALPRPTFRDAQDRVVQRGDRVLIGYILGKRENCVVIGATRRIAHTDFLNKTHLEGGNTGGARVRMRFEPRDGSNNALGRVDVRVSDDGTGTLDVRCTDRLVLRVGSDTEGDNFTEVAIEGGRVVITADETGTTGTTRLNNASSTNKIPRADRLESQLTLIRDAISAAPVAPMDGGATFKAALVSALAGLGATGVTATDGVYGD